MDAMDGYIRVSRTMGRSGPGYISPDVQRESIQGWADYNKVQVLAWHEDYDESGGTQNRPGLRTALDRIGAGESGGLICWRVDRFARNVGPAEGDLELIRQREARIAFSDENLDTSGPMGEFLMTMLLSMARLQLQRLSAGWKTARGRAIERGAFIGKAPVGYRKIRDKNNPKLGALEPDPDRRHLVEEAYRLAADEGLHVAARYLKHHLPGSRWEAFQTRRLLANRVYIGESRHGDELVNPDAHEPLVSLGAWIAAQVDGVQPRMRSLDYPLSGIARCAGCDGPLVGQVGHARKDGTVPRRYRCSVKWNEREHCDAPASCMADPLEEEVRKELRLFLDKDDVAEGSAGTDRIAELEREVVQARADHLQVATDTDLQRALGRSYVAAVKARADALEAAEGAVAKEATRRVQRSLPLAKELDDPEQFRRGLAVVDYVEITRGGGLLTGRVDVRFKAP